MSRADDPAIQDILRHMREVNVQNPEYSEIKRILEEGADGRYKDVKPFDDHGPAIEGTEITVIRSIDSFVTEEGQF